MMGRNAIGRLMVLFALAAACGDDETKNTTDTGTLPDATSDMGTEPDTGAVADMAEPADMGTRPDMAPPADMDANMADADMSAPDMPTLPCEADELVESGMCVACPAGTTNDAGDDPTGADTSCDPVICEADEAVTMNVCTACPTDATNDAGDDASGADTFCDDDCSAIFVVTCDLWEQAYIKASNTEGGDFISTVAIDGDTLVIGAPYEDSGDVANPADNSTERAGAAYVYRRTGNTWQFEAYLKASNPDVEDRFGSAVAISGDTIAVSAIFEDSNATGIDGDETSNAAADSGAVYVFARQGTTWTQQAYVKASNTDADDEFGFSVALDGETLVVGSQYESSNATGVNGDEANNAASRRGAAYVFTRSGTTWSQQAYLKSSNNGIHRFGQSVDVDGDMIAVGAPFESSGATGVDGDQNDITESGSGAVYLFSRSGTTWAQDAYVKASNTDGGDRFGNNVALSGDTLAVTAWGERSAATGIDGNQADNSAPSAGAAYVFARSAGVWSQQAYVKASNTRQDGVPGNDFYGSGLALGADVLVVGAYREGSDATGLNGDQDNENAFQSGAAYLYRRTGTTWSQDAYIKASNTDGGDHFGRTMSLSGNTLAITAPDERSNATGVDGDQSNNDAESSGAVYVRRIAP